MNTIQLGGIYTLELERLSTRASKSTGCILIEFVDGRDKEFPVIYVKMHRDIKPRAIICHNRPRVDRGW